jgi:hypothetical protein
VLFTNSPERVKKHMRGVFDAMSIENSLSFWDK